MRIRGEKPWALIGKKIVRFKTQEEFDRWEEDHIRRRVEETDKLGPEDFYTGEQVMDYIRQKAANREVRLLVTRQSPKKKIRRRRLWPA